MSEAVAAPLSRLFSDERLTRRAVGGDEQAFAAIFSRYHQSLYRFCLAIVGNPEDASDALQNTMIKVLRALPGEERKIELKPWLYRIAHNESIDLLRRRRETSALDVEQIAPGYGLAEDAATRERLRRLLVDLKELPERQREVLVMRELAGLGFEEISSALDTSGAVARQTLYEARQSLQQMETGREMSCATVTKALSDGDGRVTRRRDVRAHLRSCAHCQAFREELKIRQRDLAALSPLPAAAAAGMLQGLLGGGSHGAATGGGLATTLGGGAAKSIGASAAAKGVATVAVVAAIGVTAADRGGVIHLGLPGEQATKAAAPASQAPPAVPAANGSGGGDGAGAHGSRSGGKSNMAASSRGVEAAAPAGAAGPQVDSAVAEGAAPGSAAAHAHRQAQPHELVGAETQGPRAEHPSGEDHEKLRPEAAEVGQEVAATHKPPQESDASTDDAGGAPAAKPTPPAHQETGPSAAPGPPASTPGSEAPGQSQAAAATEHPGPPPQSRGAEKASEAAAGTPGAGARSEKAP